MMSNTEKRFRLDPTSTKHICPSCNKKRFVRIVDTYNEVEVPDYFGKCDRHDECKYIQFVGGSDWIMELTRQERNDGRTPQPRPKEEPKPKVNIPDELVLHFEKNNAKHQNLFLDWYHRQGFSQEEVSRAAALYRIGTIGETRNHTGSVVFNFIDYDGYCRYSEVKAYDKRNNTVKYRDKDGQEQKSLLPLPRLLELEGQPQPWHEAYKKQPTKKDCFFGVHLLKKYPNNPVYLVEAPKTAFCGTLYFGHPEDNRKNPIWMASGGLENITQPRYQWLKGRVVTLIPDADGVELWRDKAADMTKKGVPATCSRIALEMSFTNNDLLSTKTDLADILQLFPVDFWKGRYLSL